MKEGIREETKRTIECHGTRAKAVAVAVVVAVAYSIAMRGNRDVYSAYT